MTKPIFLKVIVADGTPCLVAVSNQTHSVAGTDKAIDTKVQCTPRAVLPTLEEGEYWGTDTLVYKSQGWYVCGQLLYKLTDELGMIVTDFENESHREMAEMYRDFSQGRPMRTDFCTANVTAEKARPKPKPLMERLRFDKRLSVPTIENDGWYVDEGLWYFLVRNYMKKKNMLLVGASGCGKTELVRFIMKKLAKPIQVFDMAVSNPNKTFCGNLRADNGSTHYQLARFAKEIQHENLILMDELSRASPTANNIFMPLLDKRRTLYIEDAILEKEQQIVAHEKCVFWATANIGSEFIGTSTLDHALLNRFGQAGVEYPPQDKESLLLQKLFELDKRGADALVSVAHLIRTNANLSKDISTRQLFEIAELIQDGYKPLEAFKWTVLQQFEGSEHDGGERATVLTILQSL